MVCQQAGEVYTFIFLESEIFFRIDYKLGHGTSLNFKNLKLYIFSNNKRLKVEINYGC